MTFHLFTISYTWHIHYVSSWYTLHIKYKCFLLLTQYYYISFPLYSFQLCSSLPHALQSHPLNHTHSSLPTHTPHSSARNPHRRQSISHRPHSTPGYWTNGSNSTPTVIARITGCIAVEDNLCAKRKRQREKRPGDRRMEKQMARERKEWWNPRDDRARLTGSAGRRDTWKCISLQSHGAA